MPVDNSYKAFFLGPKAENRSWVRAELQSIVDSWFQYREGQFIDDISPISPEQSTSIDFLQYQRQLTLSLQELKQKLKDETPTYTPRYIGQMTSETSLPAIFGHFAAMLHNPNITSKQASRIGCAIEDEAISMLAEMVGYESHACGHFTGGGTVANFEAIWRARFRMDCWLSLALYLAEHQGQPLDTFASAHMGWQRYEQLLAQYQINEQDFRPYSMVAGNAYRVANLFNQHLNEEYLGPVVLVPGNKHFSWQKGINIFGLGEEAFWSIDLDVKGKLSIDSLKLRIEEAKQQNRPILMIVCVAGTTETGEIDPVDDIAELLAELKQQDDHLDLWLHIDAAYGGFLTALLGNESYQELLGEKTSQSLKALSRANSITLDPHKLGYVPYACGAFITKDAQNYRVSSFHAPYIDRPDVGPDKWSVTLEGSRSATGATATWLTGKSIGFKHGRFNTILANSIQFCRFFKQEILSASDFINPLNPTETNILCFSIANKNDSLTKANENSETVFQYFIKSPLFSISKTILSTENYNQQIVCHVGQYNGVMDSTKLVLLRCVFMNPFLADPVLRASLVKQFTAELQLAYDTTLPH